jgi:hypothetical protein
MILSLYNANGVPRELNRSTGPHVGGSRPVVRELTDFGVLGAVAADAEHTIVVTGERAVDQHRFRFESDRRG